MTLEKPHNILQTHFVAVMWVLLSLRLTGWWYLLKPKENWGIIERTLSNLYCHFFLYRKASNIDDTGGKGGFKRPSYRRFRRVLRSHNCGQDSFLGQGRSCVKYMGLLEVRTKARSSFLWQTWAAWLRTWRSSSWRRSACSPSLLKNHIIGVFMSAFTTDEALKSMPVQKQIQASQQTRFKIFGTTGTTMVMLV